jgi:CheY-like chemotaxis protein
VEAREISRTEGTALLEFAVTDSGIGIAREKQDLLFKPFSQADSSTTREYGGTGLGLSIVRSLALLMGGDVGVDSESGQGARFWFRIRAEALDAESRQMPHTAESGTAPAVAGLVLVVEDNPTNRKVVEALLGKMGLRARCVENGQEAVEAVTRGTPPDLILMDIQMPLMNGIEATEIIRRWERDNGRPPLPIVALTAGAFEDDRQQCLAAGMDDFLAKPVNMNALAAVMAQWLGSQTAG